MQLKVFPPSISERSFTIPVDDITVKTRQDRFVVSVSLVRPPGELTGQGAEVTLSRDQLTRLAIDTLEALGLRATVANALDYTATDLLERAILDEQRDGGHEAADFRDSASNYTRVFNALGGWEGK